MRAKNRLLRIRFVSRLCSRERRNEYAKDDFCSEVQSDAGQKSSFAYSFRRSREHNLETTKDAPRAIYRTGVLPGSFKGKRAGSREANSPIVRGQALRGGGNVSVCPR